MRSKAIWDFHGQDATSRHLPGIRYLKKFGYSGEQAYVLLGSAPIEGRISGIVDILNACCSLYVPKAIFDFDVRPTADGPVLGDRGRRDGLRLTSCRSTRPPARSADRSNCGGRWTHAPGPAACPACRAPARRVFSPPGLVVTPAPLRRALDLEERSADAPAITDRPRGRPLPAPRRRAHPPWVAGGC